jgi:SAM-dependent methyltransferase
MTASTRTLTFVALLTAVACRKPQPQPKPLPDTHAKHQGQAQSPSAIECPLAKLGIKPEHLQPFDDVEKYIAFLERPDRASWQRPGEVVRALGLADNEIVADVGAGSGYFTFRFARALPAGQVVAIDIQPEMIRHIHHKAMTEGVANVRVALGKAADPGVPATATLVFMCDVLHHVPDRAAWLGKLVGEMAAGARLALVEFKEGKLPEGPPESVKIPKAELMAMVERAGLELLADRPKLLPYQYFLVFRKPPRAL